jgi:molecular chaperone GrpE
MEKEKCQCEEEKCTCGEECNCDSECNCSEECTCGDDCNCTEEDNCGCGGKCNHEKKKEKKKKDKHEDKLNEAYNMISELEDKLLREKAELVNYRKRKEEETSRMLMYSNEDLAKSLLPIVDNFERAINMDDDNLEDEVSKFLAGFKMIYCNLINTLEKYGVKAIDGANKPFDPTYHQAIMTEKRDGVEPEMVIEVLQKGYLLKDKVIRPAMVKVSE